MGLASCHSPGAFDFEVVPSFLEKFCTPEFVIIMNLGPLVLFPLILKIH